MTQDEASGGLHLLRGILGHAKRWILSRRHFRIPAGMAEAIKVETPHIEAGIVERVAPRPAIETMSDRKRRWERRAVNVEDRAARLKLRICRRQKSEKKRQSPNWTGNVKMLLSSVELMRGREIGCARSFFQPCGSERGRLTGGHPNLSPHSMAYCARSRLARSGRACSAIWRLKCTLF